MVTNLSMGTRIKWCQAQSKARRVCQSADESGAGSECRWDNSDSEPLETLVKCSSRTCDIVQNTSGCLWKARLHKNSHSGKARLHNNSHTTD